MLAVAANVRADKVGLAGRFKSSATGAVRWPLVAVLVVLALTVCGYVVEQAAYAAGGGAPAASGTFKIIGKVINAHPAFGPTTPAAGATVRMYGSHEQTTTTDGQGNFTFVLTAYGSQPNPWSSSYAVYFETSKPAPPGCATDTLGDATRAYIGLTPLYWGNGSVGETVNVGTLYLGTCERADPGSFPVQSRSDDQDITACPTLPPHATDTTFVTTASDAENFSPRHGSTGNVFRKDGPILINVPVNRVVGEVNSDGALQTPQELIDNQVVSEYATVKIMAYDVDHEGGDPQYRPERDKVYLNGEEIGYLEGSDKEWREQTLSVPIRLLHFGRKSNSGGPSLYSDNELKIEVDNANEKSGKSRWGTTVAWASIKFSALAPVVMIHGNSSCGNFWNGDVDTPCSGNRKPENQRFVYPFIQQKIPYDHSLSLAPPAAPIDDHLDQLVSGIPHVAAKFGAKHIHIVAHSKGGLDTRKFLAVMKEKNIDLAVLSLTTLSTPHQGSPGADYQFDTNDARRHNTELTKYMPAGRLAAVVSITSATVALSDNRLHTALALGVPPNGGTESLLVRSLDTFNVENGGRLPRSFTVDGQTSQMHFFAVTADANLDNSTEVPGQMSPWKPTISLNETEWLPWPKAWRYEIFPQMGKAKIYQILYRMIGKVKSTHINKVPAGWPGAEFWTVGEDLNEVITTPSGTQGIAFYTNDLAVPWWSALGQGNLKNYLIFDDVHWALGNHATITKPPVAEWVIGKIKGLQPME